MSAPPAALPCASLSSRDVAPPESLVPGTALSDGRVRGLDTIRFVLASWVVLSHNGLFPLFEGVNASSRVGWLAKGLYGTSVNGAAAVIVFFVISGFCIHFPYRKGGSIRPSKYYPRRYLRILVPLGAAVAIARLLKADIDSVLWSIVCEEIYYLVYPFLLLIRRRVGWSVLIGSAFAASLAVTWSNPTARDYWANGWRLTWLLGLPCWLLGCRLAELSDSLHRPVADRTIWAWRFAVWLASSLCLFLRFHSPAGYPHTLNLFAILSYFWLQREICYFRSARPPELLERAGKWSYSLYLIHVPANALYNLIPFPNLGFICNWLLGFGWSLGASYGFYLLVEKPSHALARWLGRREGIAGTRPGATGTGVRKACLAGE